MSPENFKKRVWKNFGVTLFLVLVLSLVWEFGLKGKNLLDTKSLNRSSETDYAYASSTYYVQPRYFLFAVKYKL